MTIPVHGWQYEILACPFCKKGEISCMWFPAAVSVKRNLTASLPGGGSMNKSKDTWVIKSGCPSCGKAQEEIANRYRQEGLNV